MRRVRRGGTVHMRVGATQTVTVARTAVVTLGRTVGVGGIVSGAPPDRLARSRPPLVREGSPRNTCPPPNNQRDARLPCGTGAFGSSLPVALSPPSVPTETWWACPAPSPRGCDGLKNNRKSLLDDEGNRSFWFQG